jgi:uncharacterized repeat protein (TIGR03803 family)
MNRKAYSRMTLGLATVLTIALSLPSNVRAASWKEKVLYSFQNDPDGKWPAGGVIFGKDGNLYGATQAGGGDIGTVFQLAKQGNAWNETVLHEFTGKPNNDGDNPASGLIADSQGNLYGVTQAGGMGNCTVLGLDVGCGLVYEMSPPAVRGGAWTETIIYNFQGGQDGYAPSGNLIFDGKGNLYGATQFGGGGGGSSCNPYFQYCGTIFELSPPKQKGGAWTEKLLYSFKNGKDGGQPNGGLTFDKHGALYGTTYCGGIAACQNGLSGYGVVFRLKLRSQNDSAWTYGVLHSFNGNDGFGPAAGLLLDRGGIFYGTTVAGGSTGAGNVFSLTPPTKKVNNWRIRVLYTFKDGSDGTEPMAVPLLDKAGNLYGTALGGEKHGGVVFRLQPAKKSWSFGVLYSFTGGVDGWGPEAVLVSDALGSLYSTTQGGGTGQSCQGGCGTVFKVSP